MKGLIIKDILTIKSTLKTYMLLFAFYGVLGSTTGNTSMLGFAAVFVSMLPTTALAYDERANFNRYALTMPVTRKDLVLSKYAFAFVLSVFTIIVTLIMLLFVDSLPMEEKVSFAAMMFCLNLIMQGVLMPLMFKFGTEKGRIYMMAVYFLSALSVFLLIKFPGVVKFIKNLPPVSPVTASIIFVGLTAVLYLLSIFISLGIISKKEF